LLLDSGGCWGPPGAAGLALGVGFGGLGAGAAGLLGCAVWVPTAHGPHTPRRSPAALSAGS
jgi:hypothetical protein